MFKELDLSPSYYSDSVDVVEGFYNPVLSSSISYDRVSAYFSSKALASYSKGLSGLIKNNGKMRLIVSIEISMEDFELIKKGYKLREDTKLNILKKLDETLTPREEMNFYNLAHLIANDYVDVKIGFTNAGIFHSKFGLCEDENGNIIYFTGSNNETQAALKSNYEAFDITASWLTSDFDSQKIYKARDEFNKLWLPKKDSKSMVYVKNINEVIKNKIIKYDKGRLILNTETLTDDALILTYENDRLVLYDNLKNFIISKNDRVINKKLFPFFESEYPYFSPKLTSQDIETVIETFEKYAKRKNFKFIVTDELNNYLQKISFFINERAKLGNAIKYYEEKLDLPLEKRFKNFKNITQNELERTLRSKQMWSAFYMKEMKNAANFSVPGAGKTSMVYGAFAYLNSKTVNEVDKIVMIGPKSSFLSWKDEFNSNFGDKKKLSVLDIHERNFSNFEFTLESGNVNLILINYESLPKYESVLSDVINSKTMLVFDEVHKIKGLESVRAHSAKRISQNAGYKYVLSGTPIPNTYQDIYNFLNILYNQDYKIYFNFDKNNLVNPNPILIEEVNEKLYPFFWRTTKSELQVPPADTDNIINISATSKEQDIIDLLHKKHRGNPFSLYIRLMQASANPELLLKSLDFNEIYEEDLPFDIDEEKITYSNQEINLIKQVPETSKYFAAINLAEKLYNENKQTIIWCMFVNTIDKVYRDLSSKGIKTEIIYGNTPQEEREYIIKQFINNEIDVLVTNPHTLAESVSLHHSCHDAIYLEYSFNLTHMLQSRDRIHRLGLKEDDYTRYYYFMLQGQEDSRNTIDEKIYTRLKEKETKMLEAIENGRLEPDPEVDLDEILNLLTN